MAEERRRYPRYHVKELRGTLDGRHRFLVLQLSRTGMLAAAGLEPALGQRLEIEIALKEAPFRAVGRVLFVGEDNRAPSNQRFRIGLEFADLAADNERTLTGFIAQLEPEPE